MKSDNDKFSTVSLCHVYIKPNLYASLKKKNVVIITEFQTFKKSPHISPIGK